MRAAFFVGVCGLVFVDFIRHKPQNTTYDKTNKPHDTARPYIEGAGQDAAVVSQGLEHHVDHGAGVPLREDGGLQEGFYLWVCGGGGGVGRAVGGVCV